MGGFIFYEIVAFLLRRGEKGELYLIFVIQIVNIEAVTVLVKGGNDFYALCIVSKRCCDALLTERDKMFFVYVVMFVVAGNELF